jgi:multidrug efflux pump subunit AcrA (membrane-fusion protein)
MSVTRTLAGEAIRIAAPLLILAGGVAGAWFLWSLRTPPDVVEPEVRPPLVETVEARSHDSGLVIPTDGLVAPARDVTVATQVAGKIVYKSPSCEAGKFVRQDEVLFRIDAEDYQLEVERLTKEREQADANLQEADLEIRNTESLIELAREDVQLQQRELQRQLQAGRQAVSQSALDQTRRAELAARNTVQTLENQKRLLQSRRDSARIARDLAEVKLKKAQLDLARTEVGSPVDGVIVEEMVEEDSFVPVGSALAKIEDTATAEVRCSLKMEELQWLRRQRKPQAGGPYKPMRFTADAEPETGFNGEASPAEQLAYQIPRAPVTVIYEAAGQRFAWDGELDRFEGIGVDERTRTVPCRVVVPNPRSVRRMAPGVDGPLVGPQALVRGMYVQLRIHAELDDGALVSVPEETIRPGGKVWVARNIKPLAAESDGAPRFSALMFEERVEVAAVVDGRAILDAAASGVRPGEHIVATPLALERDEQVLLTGAGLPVEFEREAARDAPADARGSSIPQLR